MNSIFNYCIRNKFLSVNPYSKVSCKPKSGDHRERIATAEDIEKLRFCADWDGVSEPRTLPQLVVLAFEFACATGMRIGEILQLQADWINGNTIHLPKEITKTGFKRDVALSSEAKSFLPLQKISEVIQEVIFQPSILNKGTLFGEKLGIWQIWGQSAIKTAYYWKKA